MLDIHTHILPALDDGAKSTEEALKMLEMLKEQDVTDVVLTPHFYFYNQNLDVFLERRDAAFKELSEAAPDGIKLHLGAEIGFLGVSIDYKVFSKLSINGGRYILLELPFSGDYEKDILPKLERFIYHTGLTPIIAHIERYKAVRKQPKLIRKLINMGCLIQVNAESVAEVKPKSLVDAILKHGQVHLIGSDCHNLSDRSPQYAKAYDVLKEKYGEATVNAIEDIGKSVISNGRAEAFADSEIEKLFGKYR